MPRERKGSKNKNNPNVVNDANESENIINTKTANKKRRTSNANNNSNNNNQNNANNNINNNLNNNKALELIPPQPIVSFGDTIHASNPFDDTPQSSQSQQSTPQSQQTTPQPSNQSPNNNMIVSNASNPTMPPLGPQSQGLQQSVGAQQQPKPVPLMSGKVYPAEQSMVFNPANPNAPPIYPCGICHKEVHDNDQAILCESGCNFWFHRGCTGISERAYLLLTQEVYAEWVCDKCLTSKSIPLVKFKP
jgi:hypothetical protein